ncbi:MAG: A/G-specific adenine glycosylase [Acidiferrobacteraceae bacterium]|nr:A/G-specific adenine glycosylase [Acidiferrobacteraceae bacterium]|tara:strand:- start:1573 stop:2664 length:1092 start_codon:yes stop_codon:yes gene_type:complete
MRRIKPLSVNTGKKPLEVSFSANIIEWHQSNGRHGLPWQRSNDPYSRWISEIMLQQTQVSTVIPYFKRFMKRFPTIGALSSSQIDEVLEYWAGLGYYARARNLWKAAKVIMREHNGVFPDSYEKMIALPGIGRSTAGAILAFSYNQSYPILDGNVRRVLTRYHAIPGWPGKASVLNNLWGMAEQHLPPENIGAYTQGIMDIGAEICLRRRPHCHKCPLANDCLARKEGCPERYPEVKPRSFRRVRATTMLMVQDEVGNILLQRRPSKGIWGALWSFPECFSDKEPEQCLFEQLSLEANVISRWQHLLHSFTHFDLEIHPIQLRLTKSQEVLESRDLVWYKPGSRLGRGVAAPVRRLLKQLQGA